jgi:hypothetical protein
MLECRYSRATAQRQHYGYCGWFKRPI